MTNKLTPKQKVKVMTAYTQFLNAKAELGIKPTDAELQLLRDGIDDVHTDVEETVQTFLPVAAEYIRSVNAVVEPFRYESDAHYSE